MPRSRLLMAMPHASFLGYAGLAACLVGLAGCGRAERRPPVTITGQVSLDGAPLSSGSIQFTSGKTGEAAYANLSSDGRYTVTFPAADVGAEYDVTVGPPIEENVDATAIAEKPQQAKPKLIPRKYSDRTSSGLKAKIDKAGDNQFDFQLKTR